MSNETINIDSRHLTKDESELMLHSIMMKFGPCFILEQVLGHINKHLMPNCKIMVNQGVNNAQDYNNLVITLGEFTTLIGDLEASLKPIFASAEKHLKDNIIPHLHKDLT